MRVSSVRISTRSLRSRLVSGSSMRNARGRRTSARARATRCISPPDICAGRRCISRSMCSRSATCSTAAAISSETRCGGRAAARRCSRTPCAAGRARSSGTPWRGPAPPGCHAWRRARRGGPSPASRLLEAGDGPQRRRLARAGGSRARRRTSRPARRGRLRREPAPRRRTCAGPCATTVPIRPPAFPCSRRRRAAVAPVCRRPTGASAANRTVGGIRTRTSRWPPWSTT